MITLSRLSIALLRALLPISDRDVVLAHLEQEFDARARHAGAAAARRWHLYHVLTSVPGALRLRLRGLPGRLWADVAHAGRWTRRHPGFVAGITCTLCLGVAAANAVATLGAAVLMRPLPYDEPERLVTVQEFERARGLRSGNVSWPDFIDFRTQASSLSAVAGFTGGSRTLHREGVPPERLAVTFVTDEFFPLLGVSPHIGRTIDARDGPAQAPQVAVLSFGFWHTHFGGNPDILSRTLTLNDQRVPIVGVLPERFEFPLRGRADLYMPERPSAAQRERRYFHWLNVIARLAPDSSLEQATADLGRIAGTFAVADAAHRPAGVVVTTMRDRLVGEARPVLLVLTCAAALVLFVACANFAGLLISKGVTRGTEMAVRQALGAGRMQLVRQLLVETLVMALPGTAAGLALGQVIVRGFVDVLPRTSRLTMPQLDSLGLDGSNVAITLTTLAVTMTFFGVYPAWRTARLSGRGTVGYGRKDGRVQRVLIAGQTALAATLVAAAALMTQSMVRLLDVGLGFHPDGLLSLELNLSGARYETPGSRIQFFDEVLTHIRQVPGILGATAIDQSPLAGAGNSGEFTITGDASGRTVRTLVRDVRSDYFDVLGIPLQDGRGFVPGDHASAPPVVVISRQLSDVAFGGDAIGKRITFPWSGPEPLEVVGIVGDAQFVAVDQPMQPAMYFPASQSAPGNLTVLVRASGDPRALVPALQDRLRRVDGTIPAYNVTTIAERIATSEGVSRRRSVMVILMAFACSTLMLSAAGIFGLLSQAVGQRTREIGVRLALGATGRQVAAAVVRSTVLSAVCGIAVGIVGAFGLGRLLDSLLFGIAAADARTFIGVFLLCLAVSAAACVVPVRRARRVDPATSLRAET